MGTETIPSSKEAIGAETPSDLESQIIRQIEYYFGNYNLSRDKFLREQLQVDDGWVPLETMIKFNRLKKLSEDFNVIIEALKKSPKQLMEVSDDNAKIRRHNITKLPEDYHTRHDELEEKTVYVKGFKRNNTLDELLDFFRAFGVEHVFMRRNVKQNNKPFKGSVFVIFESKEDAEKFLSTKGIKYKGTELLKEWKKDYVKRKDEVYNALREERAKKERMKAALKEEGIENDQAEEKKSTTGDDESTKDMVRGCLLKLSNLNTECNRERIKDVFEPLGNLVYVDYHHGLPSAVIRFDNAVASEVLEKINEEEGEKKIKIGTSEAVVTAVEGDEEEEYWKFISKSRIKSRERNSNKRMFGNKGHGNKGNFKKWGKRKSRDEDEKDEKTNDKSSEPSPKKLKVESVVESIESSVVENIESSVVENTQSSVDMEVASSEVKTETHEIETES